MAAERCRHSYCSGTAMYNNTFNVTVCRCLAPVGLAHHPPQSLPWLFTLTPKPCTRFKPQTSLLTAVLLPCAHCQL